MVGFNDMNTFAPNLLPLPGNAILAEHTTTPGRHFCSTLGPSTAKGGPGQVGSHHSAPRTYLPITPHGE